MSSDGRQFFLSPREFRQKNLDCPETSEVFSKPVPSVFKLPPLSGSTPVIEGDVIMIIVCFFPRRTAAVAKKTTIPAIAKKSKGMTILILDILLSCYL